jgi:hypothetical protein
MTANDNSRLNSATQDKAWFCPGCSSASIEASELGGKAKCTTCTWTGTVDDLVTYRFTHGHASKEEILHHFALDVRNLLSKQIALEFGKMLLKWGFVSLPTDSRDNKKFSQTIARYLGGAAQAIAKSVVETRAAIEKEEHDAGSTQG